jgi:diguanylate cyclase (GGDEF)-like protein/PAS domain S-box-containing protein
VGPALAGRLAGGVLLAGCLAAMSNAYLGPSSRTAGSVVVAVALAALAVFGWFAPWERWGRRSTLFLLIPGLAFVGAVNHAGREPYLAGVYVVVIGAWIGLGHGRFVTLASAPVLALGFWLPLALAHRPGLGFATVGVTVVTVTVGEALAYLRSRLERARHDLSDAKARRFTPLVQRASEVTIVSDADGGIRHLSPGAEETFGFTPEAFVGRSLTDFITNNVDLAAGDDWPSLLGRATATETRVKHRDGQWIDVEVIGQDRTDDPDIHGFVLNIREIRAQKQLERRLQRQAYFDDLTGLPNRASFLRDLGARLAVQQEVSVLFIDLEGLEAINDTAGPDVGDVLLRLVADRLAGLFGEPAVVARFGGDEFAVSLPANDRDGAAALAADAVTVLGDPFRIGVRTFSVSANVGIAIADGEARSSEDLVRAADTAMYVAKNSAAEQIAVYEPAMRERLVARLAIETDLREAIDRREFVLYFQPIVDLTTGLPCAAEALVRWQHPTKGLVPPGVFIEIAETTGLVVPLGRWVIDDACRRAARWQRPGHPVSVGVNVSARQFQDQDLLRDIRDALDRHGLDPKLLKIEVTESVLAGDLDATLARLDELHAIGVMLALDDFGTGYSSLSYLQQLPFDMLKIDKSFIDHIARRPRDQALARTINQLGHDLELVTLAEGIETAEQEQLIRELGVDFAQGYYYSRPLTASGLAAYLNEQLVDRAQPAVGAPREEQTSVA